MKKIISVVLCLAIVLTTAFCIFADNKKTINYVSLGASQTWGQGSYNPAPEQFSKWTGSVEDWQAWNANKLTAPAWNPYELTSFRSPESAYNIYGAGTIAETAFPYIIKTEIEKQGYYVNFEQLAFSGANSSDLLALLNNDYMSDYTRYFQMDDIFQPTRSTSLDETIAYYRDKYQTAVKNADFITYDFGENEVSDGVFRSFGSWSDAFSEYVCPDYEHILSPNDYENYKIVRERLLAEFNKVLDRYGIDEREIMPIQKFIDYETYGILMYCCNLDTIMDYIYSVNPDVTVCVLQIQNFYSGLKIRYNDIEIPAGELAQVVIDILNTYATSFSKYCDRYYYSISTVNQRVEFNSDLIRAYSGPEDISTNFIDILDVEDITYDIHIKSMLAQEYAKVNGKTFDSNDANSQIYENTLNACYDATLQLFSYIFNNHTATLTGLLNANVDDIKPVINTMLGEIANTFINGNGDYQDAIEHAIENFDKLPDDDKGGIAMLLETQIACSTVFHPTSKGQQEMAQGVINAMKDNNIGMKSMLGGIVFSAKSIKKSVNNIAACIDEIVASVVNDPVEFITAIVPPETIKEYIKETVQNKIDTVVSNITSNLKLCIKPTIK